MDAPEAASVEKEHEKEEGNRGKENASEILYGDPPNSLQSPATPAPLLNSADADLTQPEVLPNTMRDTSNATPADPLLVSGWVDDRTGGFSVLAKSRRGGCNSFGWGCCAWLPASLYCTALPLRQPAL